MPFWCTQSFYVDYENFSIITFPFKRRSKPKQQNGLIPAPLKENHMNSSKYSNKSRPHRVTLPCLIGFAALSFPAGAAPFAYVNSGAVIDTATTEVVGSTVGGTGIAVSPDGRFVAAASGGSVRGQGTVTIADTVTNKRSTARAGDFPTALAFGADGKRVFVTNDYVHGVCTVGCTEKVWEIDAVTGKAAGAIDLGMYSEAVAASPTGALAVVSFYDNVVSILNANPSGSIPVGNFPSAAAFSPDGRHAYIANQGDATLSLIDMATLSVAGTIAVADGPNGVAITPDGSRAFVTTVNVVSVVDTAAKTIVANVPVADLQGGVAVTPDGKHVYVGGYENVRVIDTATNSIVASVPVGGSQIAIVPPPPGVPFLSFSAQAAIRFGNTPNHDDFDLRCRLTLRGTESKGVNPPPNPITVQVGTFTVTIPPRSFTKRGADSFTYMGVIGGVRLHARIRPAGALRYIVEVLGRGANLAGSKNPIQVSLIIGNDSGTTSVSAQNLAFLGQ
jgi:YVTN family beta-propeller protein